MRHVHDFEPIVTHRFERRNTLTHSIHQDFSAASRNRSEPCLFEIRNDSIQRFVEYFAEMHKLAWTEPVDVYLGKLALKVGEQIEVPLFRQFRMMAALHQNLSAAQSDGFLNFSIQFAWCDNVSVGVPFRTIESAKLAIDVANVRVVYVPIDDVSNYLISPALISGGFGELPASIRQGAQFLKRQTIELLGLSPINPPAIPHLL